MITIKAVPTQAIFLGRVGENERLRVAFDVGPYLTEYPGASFVLLNQGPEDAQPYPCAEVALDGTTLYWIITSADVHAEGRGRCELIVTVDDVTAKSIIFDTRIMRSLTGTGAVPPDWAAWLETFAEYKADAETAATEAEAASEAIQDMRVSSTLNPVGIASVMKLVNPETGKVELRFGIPQGAPGFSPEIYVYNIQGGHRVIITREDGTTRTFDVMDGANGADGATGPQGEPGFSPTVQVTDITGGHQVAITDLEGTHTFDVMDGEVTQEEFDELKSAVTALDNAVEQLESGSLSALGASEGQVPVAAGDGTWAWGDAPGGGGTEIQPDKIQAIVAAGKARDHFAIGDVIYIPWTNYTPSTPVVYQFPFVVVHIGDAYDKNDVLHEDALWLMAMYAEPEEIIFDAAEDTVVNLAEEPNALAGWYYWGLTGTDQYTELKLAEGAAIPITFDSVHKCAINNLGVLRYGYNRWRDSAYRQWLNSDAAKNANWWTEQHEGDKAPTTTYTNKPGWLYGFEKRWLDVIKPVKVQTAANTVTDGGVTDVTYDRFFLPSLEQMYGSPQAAGVEGEYWEYWKEETGLEAPSNGSSSDTNDSRKIPSVVNYPKGSAVYCRLRSAYRGYGINVWLVSTAGYLGNNNAYNSYRGLPACVIY